MQAISLEDDVFVLRRQLESLETKCDRLRDYVDRLTGFAIRYASPSSLDAGGRALIEEARAALAEGGQNE
jgi:hypothetical protein